MNYQQTKELYEIVNRVVSETPKHKFSKTVRGLQLDKLEFIFSTNKDVKDDNYIVVKGKTDHCIRSQSIRQKLLNIYNS